MERQTTLSFNSRLDARSIIQTAGGAGRESHAFFSVMKVSPEAVTMGERKAWKNRCLASGIVTRLLPALFNFLELRAPRAKENLKSMEQCF